VVRAFFLTPDLLSLGRGRRRGRAEWIRRPLHFRLSSCPGGFLRYSGEYSMRKPSDFKLYDTNRQPAQVPVEVSVGWLPSLARDVTTDKLQQDELR